MKTELWDVVIEAKANNEAVVRFSKRTNDDIIHQISRVTLNYVDVWHFVIYQHQIAFCLYHFSRIGFKNISDDFEYDCFTYDTFVDVVGKNTTYQPYTDSYIKLTKSDEFFQLCIQPDEGDGFIATKSLNTHLIFAPGLCVFYEVLQRINDEEIEHVKDSASDGDVLKLLVHVLLKNLQKKTGTKSPFD